MQNERPVPEGRPASMRRGRRWRYLALQLSLVHGRLALVQCLVRLIPFGALDLVRARLYRLAGFALGPRVQVAGPLTVWGAGDIAGRLSIGEGSFVNSPAHIELNAPVRIGARCALGHHLVIVTTNHTLGPAERRAGETYHEPVVIGDGVWIGASVTILPGVHIGDGAFVTAGTIVTRDVPANARVAGARGVVVDVMSAAAPARRRPAPAMSDA